MTELEAALDKLIRQVKDPKKRKDLIDRQQKFLNLASQSKEQPLDKLTRGKLEEIEKLKAIVKLNNELIKSAPFRTPYRSEEDERNRTIGVKGQSRVRQALPKGTKEENVQTKARLNHARQGGTKLGKLPAKQETSRTPVTITERSSHDDPTATGEKGRSSATGNLPVGESKKKEKKSFWKKLLGKKPKDEKPKKEKKSFLKRLLGNKPRGAPIKQKTPTGDRETKPQSSKQARRHEFEGHKGKGKKGFKQQTNIEYEKPKKEGKTWGQYKEEIDRKIDGNKPEETKKPKGNSKKPKGNSKKPKGNKKPTTDFTSNPMNELDESLKRLNALRVRNRRKRKNKAIIKSMHEFLSKDGLGYGNLWTANIMSNSLFKPDTTIGKTKKKKDIKHETYIVNRRVSSKDEQDN